MGVVTAGMLLPLGADAQSRHHRGTAHPADAGAATAPGASGTAPGAPGASGTAPGHTGAAPGHAMRVIPIPVLEVNAMMQRQRVWMFTPPPGQGAFGLGSLGDGRRVWVLLPSCRRPNPDDPRDPCPVMRAAMELVTGSGTVTSVGPLTVGPTPDSRRVQSFVIPAGVEQVRVKLLRQNNSVRYEAVFEASGLTNLPLPEGRPQGPDRFVFNLQRYPSL